MSLQRLPYITTPIEARNLKELNEYLSRELRHIEFAMLSYEESQTVDILEQTADASTASYLFLDCSATAIVITLPPASRVTGKRFTIKKTDSSANKAAIRTVASDTIDGAASASLTAQYQVKAVISDGINWNVI